MSIKSLYLSSIRTLGVVAAGAAMLTFAGTSASAADMSMKDMEMPVTPGIAVSFNFGVTTDYVFRGESQTSEEGAVFGGMDLTYGMFYAGVWASRIDFGADENVEIDLYTGIRKEYSGIEFDLGVIYYGYPNQTKGQGAELDYVELKLGASTKIQDVSVGLTFYYSPEYFAESGSTLVTEGTIGIPLPEIMGFSLELSGTLGYVEFFDSSDDFAYWNVGVTKTLIEGFAVDVRYWGREDAGCGSNCDDRIVGTLTISN
jgi:uncharacterized protein (TIGR02001 family)